MKPNPPRLIHELVHEAITEMDGWDDLFVIANRLSQAGFHKEANEVVSVICRAKADVAFILRGVKKRV